MERKDTKHVVTFKSTKLMADETVVSFLVGYIGEMMGKGDKTQRHGTLIVTNQRVAFYRKGIFGEILETIPIENISSIETSSMMGHRVLTFHTSNDELKFKTFESADLTKKVYDYVETERQKTPPGASQATLDPVSQIRALAELRDSGILTEEEFQTKKLALLSKI